MCKSESRRNDATSADSTLTSTYLMEVSSTLKKSPTQLDQPGQAKPSQAKPSQAKLGWLGLARLGWLGLARLGSRENPAVAQGYKTLYAVDTGHVFAVYSVAFV